jgi:uncharacterized membrane protein
MKYSTPAFLILLTGLVFTQCSKDKNNTNNNFTVDCSTVTNKAFAANISPLVQSRCAIPGCHAAGSGNGPGALTTYAQISSASARIRTAVANGTMPQGSTLTTAEKNSIVCWIDSGSPNN